MSEFDNVSGNGAPTAGSAGTPEAPVPATQGTPAPAATQPTTQAPATGQSQEAMVPSYRLREQREHYERQVQQIQAQQEAHWRAQVEERERKIQALAGVVPQQTSEEDAIRQQFAKLFPHLGNLSPEKIERLEALMERSGDLEAQNSHYWQSYGQQSVSKLFSLAETDLGGALSDGAKRNLHSALIGYIQSDPTGQLVQEYSSNPNFISDFWKEFSSSFIDPVRRTQAAATIGRAGVNVPQNAPSGGVRTGTPAPKPADMNERAALSWTAYQQSKK